MSLWIAIGGALLSLLLAANSKRKREQCSGYSVSVLGNKENQFVSDKDVVHIISSVVKGEIKGTVMASFDLSKMESALQKNKWIKDAELWFDSHNILHIMVKERIPVARIFTTAGESFYIDSSLAVMPLSANVNIRIPVFTGFPDGKKMGKTERLLLKEIKDVASFVSADDFWKAQVMQVDITEQKRFEMIPALGNHVVRLGSADELDKKFRRLRIFYEQVLSKTGMDKYSVIDVRYKGQVVALKKGAAEEEVNENKLKQNIDNLLRSSAVINDNNDMYVRPGKPRESKPDSVVVPPATIPADPNAVKTIIPPDTAVKRKPKAVMTGRTNQKMNRITGRTSE